MISPSLLFDVCYPAGSKFDGFLKKQAAFFL
jgi:hypothetical protein